MIGLVITTFNRPEYLIKTLESVSQAIQPDMLLISDDCSTDYRTIDLISKYKVIRTLRNSSIRYSLMQGIGYLFNNGCDIVINLDSDCIVKKDFIEKLIALSEKFPDQIISGFNTLTKNRLGVTRHPIIEQGDGYVIKKSIGGINMLMTKSTFNIIIKPALIEAQRTKDHWDKIACRISQEQGKDIIVCSPSVIQHIGINSAMGHRDNPDIAHDFIPNKKACILQPHGIGDIIFAQTLVRSLGDYDITWPILPQFVDDLKRAYPDINFIPDKSSPVPLNYRNKSVVNGYSTVPIRFSDTIQRVPYSQVMRAKYDMYGMDFTNWKKLASWQRDYKKENELFNLLNLPKNYTLVNKTYMSDMSRKSDIDIEGIELRQIEGFSLFDWALVLEKAKEIHTVSTSLLFVLDLLETGPVHVYLRQPIEHNHSNYDYIFTDHKFIYK